MIQNFREYVPIELNVIRSKWSTNNQSGLIAKTICVFSAVTDQKIEIQCALWHMILDGFLCL